MIFIIKEGKNPKDPQNYRPISLLEIVNKVYEKIINNRLLKFLENFNLLNKNQYGFRPARGTQQALALIYETISLTQKEKSQCNLVLRDISKAFDKVWHTGLKYKILQTSLPSNYIRLLSNFMTKRKARIKVNDYLGEIFNLESGVPQGRCLSQTLFILYTSDIPDPSEDCVIVLFADDLTQIIIYNEKSRTEMALKTQREIEKYNEYEKKWRIRTNLRKFQVIPISITKPEDLSIQQEPVEYKTQGKILGLQLQRNGIHNHISNRIKLAEHKLTALKALSGTSKEIKLRLVKALVRPILEYPPIPLDTVRITNKQKMQTVQNKAIEWVLGRKRRREERMEDLHMELNLEPLNIRIKNLSRKIWSKLEAVNNNDIYEYLKRRHQETANSNEHYWWPSSLLKKDVINTPIFARS